jgi:threonine 3-dehydrogenase
MYDTWYKMASMLQSGLDIQPVITHRMAVDDYEQGFAVLNAGGAAKVVLDWV